jgi:hypothetical protein
MENKKPFQLEQAAIRLVNEPPLYSDFPLNSPQAVVKLLAELLKDYDREVFAIVNLRPDLKPINLNIVSIGALDQAIAHPREILKSAILSNAASMMLVHNHTTGRMVPSKEDIQVTDRMSKIGEMIGIKLTDHILVGPGDHYYSFCENQQLPLSGLKLAQDPKEIKLEGMKVAETATFEKEKQTDISFTQEAQLREIIDKLEQGVQEVFGSDEYKSFLNVMAKMPRYSLNNLILIAMQTEGKASMCQSFTGWKQMGRYVKQGEKGIKILAPAPYTIQREYNKLDQSGKPVLDADGEPVKERKDITINSFKVVNTFDVSQTDGKEMPSLGVNELAGNVEGYRTLIEALKETAPVPISFENIESGAKGYYHQTEKRIAIQDGMSEVQTVKTTIHEMAHQKLHTYIIPDKKEQQSRNSMEVEAESVAYVVCQHYGINTSDYSFAYVAGWSEGKEVPELKVSLDIIRQAASEMITAIDEKLQVLMINRNEIMAENAVDQNLKNNLATKLTDKATMPAVKAGFTEVNETKAETKSETKTVQEKSVKDKTTMRSSVKNKLQEGKDTMAKTSQNKTKKRETAACM